jgi:hypothetical protein
MPTTATNTYTWDPLQPSQRPDWSRMERRQMTVSTTFTKGMALAIVTATGKWGIYADAGSGGLGVFRGICPVNAVSGTDGKIVINGGNLLGTTEDTLEAYTGGTFSSAQVNGVDAAALADVGGHLLWGDFTTGEFVLPI